MPKYLALILLLAPTFALADESLQVSGAGTGSADGCYTPTLDADPWIQQANNYDIISDSGYCAIVLHGAGGLGPPQYYKNVGGTCTWANAQGGTYTVDGMSSPAPSVLPGNCDPDPIPPPNFIWGPTASTTLTDSPTQDLYYGYLLFAIGMFGTLYYFKRRR